MRVRTRVLALSVVLTTAAVAGTPLPASATSYPSRSDVQAARHSASAQAAQVKPVEGLLACDFIEIDGGGGVSTGYAHIRPGGTFAHVGQQVSGGQNIASVGMTGAATGCHLHFEVRLNEVAVTAAPFMAARGITIG